jgi:hypothetical protein
MLRRIEQNRGLLLTDAPLDDHVNELRTAFEDILALLLNSLERAETQLLYDRAGNSYRQVVGQLHSRSVPDASAIAAILPVALPFHQHLQTRLGMALKNARELLRKADNGELEIRNRHGVRYRLRQTAPV